MASICDVCGTETDVRPRFVTVWNGDEYDLCPAHYKHLSEVLDAIHFRAAQRRAVAARGTA